MSKIHLNLEFDSTEQLMAFLAGKGAASSVSTTAHNPAAGQGVATSGVATSGAVPGLPATTAAGPVAGATAGAAAATPVTRAQVNADMSAMLKRGAKPADVKAVLSTMGFASVKEVTDDKLAEVSAKFGAWERAA